MFDLLRVPRSVLYSILRDGIDVMSLGRLDSAMCSHAERPQFLNFMRSNAMSLQSTALTVGSAEIAVRFLWWIISREMKTNRWYFLHDFSPYMVTELTQRTGGQHVRTLAFVNVNEETAGIFCAVFAVCQNISNIHWKDTKHWTGLGLLQGDGEQALQELVVIGCGTQGVLRLEHSNFANLCKLHLWGGYTAATVNSLLQVSPNLVELRIKQARLDDTGLGILATGAGHLKTVMLRRCSAVTNAGAVLLARYCGALKTLSVLSCVQLTSSAVKAFATLCTALVRLKLCRTHQSELPTFARRCGATLTYLRLQYPARDGLLAIAENCFNLQELELWSCKNVATYCLVEVVSTLFFLRELVISHCSTVTDEVLAGIATHLPELEGLNLYKSSGYTVEGAIVLIRSLNFLVWLAVEAKNSIFTRVVLYMWTDKLPGLRVFDENRGTSNFEELSEW
jgi:hypothetical protein